MFVRIGIITIQKCDNYGAELQAYALGAKLRSMGYEAENIDYLYYKNPRHLKGDVLEKPVLPISLKNQIKEKLFPYIAWIKDLKNNKHKKRRHKNFANWCASNLICGREYRSVAELYENPPTYDVYMVGSDQVWNPRMFSNIKPYFLDFVTANAKCVAYASSFGVEALPGKVFHQYKQWLRRFSFIGLREKSGAEIVNLMALESEVKHVLDPTMLLTADEWKMVSKPPSVNVARPYLLLYDLIACENTCAFAKNIAAANSLQIIRIGDGDYGPGEFLWLFAHANYIVTNSFHGTVFSILNQKPFVSVIPKSMSNSGRIKSLLDSLELNNRLVYELSNFNESIINWKRVNEKLQQLKEDSIIFLRREIEEPSKKIELNIPRECYAVIHDDETIRSKSTSGGVFTALATETLSQSGVVYGAAFDEDFHAVHHIAAKSIDQLEPIRKSKYVWSDPSWAYKDALIKIKQGIKVLFSGTPCQCAAIRKMAGETENLITVDFACHGAPRSEIFHKYIEELEFKYGEKVTSYDFRNKNHGWNFPHVVATFPNGSYDTILRNDPYYLGFGLNITLREGCFKCPFVGIERKSDITIGDCWRVGASNPIADDNRGTSMVLINTARGADFFNLVKRNSNLKIFDYNLDLAQMRNEPLMARIKKPRLYERFQKEFSETKSFEQSAKLYLSRKMIFKAKIIYFIKKFGWFYFKGKQ